MKMKPARLLAFMAFAVMGADLAMTPASAQPRAREVSSGRASNGAGVNTNLFAELADEVTQKMLASQSFQRVLAGGDTPRLVIGNVSNRTNDETILVGDIGRRISEVVIESGLVRWFEFGTNEFDLVASPMLSGVAITEGRRGEYRLTLTLTLSDAYGEVKGRWSADRTYVR